jgi:hypothetical protein
MSSRVLTNESLCARSPQILAYDLPGIEVVTPTDQLNIAEGSDLQEIADISRN